ncbi:MAG: hypothetical protein M1816_000308 [Peltula sp. TS41687]|nr:MAG: hypothetical protein M1816_000308 [Peltula sp. TS41687]
MPLDSSIATPGGVDGRRRSYRGSPLSTSTPTSESPAPRYPPQQQQTSSSRSRRRRGGQVGGHRSEPEYSNYTDSPSTAADVTAEDDSGSDLPGTPTRQQRGGVDRQGSYAQAGSMSQWQGNNNNNNNNVKRTNPNPQPRRPRVQDRQRSSPLGGGASEEGRRPSDFDVPERPNTMSPQRPFATTPIRPAYAAPNFSASPAPSALPIPRFLSNRNNSSTETESESCSPLEIFFRADREEKARAKSAGPSGSS